MPKRTFEYTSNYNNKPAILDLESVFHVLQDADGSLILWFHGEAEGWSGLSKKDYDRFILAWTEWKNRADQ